MVRLDDSKFIQKALNPVVPTRETRLADAQEAYPHLRGVADPIEPMFGDMLDAFGINGNMAPAASVSFIDPDTGQRRYGWLTKGGAEDNGLAAVMVNDGETLLIPQDALRVTGSLDDDGGRSEAFRDQVRDALGTKQGMLTYRADLLEMREPSPRGGGGDHVLTLQYTAARGVPSDEDVRRFLAAKYPQARFLDAERPVPGRLHVMLHIGDDHGNNEGIRQPGLLGEPLEGDGPGSGITPRAAPAYGPGKALLDPSSGLQPPHSSGGGPLGVREDAPGEYRMATETSMGPAVGGEVVETLDPDELPAHKPALATPPAHKPPAESEWQRITKVPPRPALPDWMKAVPPPKPRTAAPAKPAKPPARRIVPTHAEEPRGLPPPTLQAYQALRLDKVVARGDYLVATVVWDPDVFSMMSGRQVQQTIISFIKANASWRDRQLDLGHIGRPRFLMFDPDGIAEVSIRSSNTRAFPQEVVVADPAPKHHRFVGAAGRTAGPYTQVNLADMARALMEGAAKDARVKQHLGQVLAWYTNNQITAYVSGVDPNIVAGAMQAASQNNPSMWRTLSNDSAKFITTNQPGAMRPNSTQTSAADKVVDAWLKSKAPDAKMSPEARKSMLDVAIYIPDKTFREQQFARILKDNPPQMVQSPSSTPNQTPTGDEMQLEFTSARARARR